MSILSQFTFKGRQREATAADVYAIAVTAGAGSGKTRVLTGRYLYLLEQGFPLRSLIAITFTEKAAREMRTRVRAELERWATLSPADIGATLVDFDAARIGTIHSLCAEILRSHPAEAGIDPGFTVLEDGLASVLRAEAIDAALVWAARDASIVQLFTFFRESELRRLLSDLFSRRLDLERWLTGSGEGDDASPLPAWSSTLNKWLHERFNSFTWQDALATLSRVQAHSPDDKLELSRRDVLARWDEARHYMAACDWDSAFIALVALRKAISATGGSKANWEAADLEDARSALRSMSHCYDEQIKPLLSKSRWALDEQAAVLLPALRQLSRHALAEYQQRKDEQQALDFDDLEGCAAHLLVEYPAVRARWQSAIRAVLVDEFQDTNDRQRQIVYALAGFSAWTENGGRASAENLGLESDRHAPIFSSTSNLFVVGDAKQSIYKFRGADVTIFRQVQADIAATGGLTVDLDLTFRAHKPLLDLLNPLLDSILSDGESAAGDNSVFYPYRVPFAPLQADRVAPKIAQPPYIEFHLGLGEDSDDGRIAAASVLADRLHALRSEGFEWSDIALLFRASTAFTAYEDALERAGIPFVTVAGRGFYNRPEIRDLLNALAAIADPTDDLALAGLLRSPGFALSDADLYHLFSPTGGDVQAMRGWSALQASTDPLHCRAAAILSELHALSGRAPAAEVLKRLLDLTSYRAILRAAPGGERMTRNIDKLLADAHRSHLVGLGEFLEYVQTLRDVGLREGEAPVEAGGAVQLMTIHKSKGLEFPVVVIADAAYEPRPLAAGALFDARLGLLSGLRDEDDARPVAWRLAYLDENAKGDAEDRRLLYVAATRAKEKLLVSGYSKMLKSGKLSLRGWLGDFGKALGVDEMILEGGLLEKQEIAGILPAGGDPIPWIVYPPNMERGGTVTRGEQTPEIESVPGNLLAPLAAPFPEKLDERSRARESDPPNRVWRVVPKAARPSGPAWVVGKLVHEALRRWRFPGDGFEAFIRPYAFEAGLADELEIRASVREVSHLLEQFRTHPLCAEIEAAERYHELPYILKDERGVLDLLYRHNEQWVVVDFKTDDVRSLAEVLEIIRREGYDRQVQRYVDVVSAWLGSRPLARLVFLRVAGSVQVFDEQFFTTL